MLGFELRGRQGGTLSCSDLGLVLVFLDIIMTNLNATLPGLKVRFWKRQRHRGQGHGWFSQVELGVRSCG